MDPIQFSRISIKNLVIKQAAFEALFGRMPRIFAAGTFRTVEHANSTVASVTTDLVRAEVTRLIVTRGSEGMFFRGSDAYWTPVPSVQNPAIYSLE